MPTVLNPYLSFKDTARAAMTFYKSVLGGDLVMSTFGEGGMSKEPAEKDKIMHGQLNAPGGMVLMGSDTPPGMEVRTNGAVSLSGEDDAALRDYWRRLSEGAMIIAPLEPAPWGDTFGMLTDRFGVFWMVNIAGRKA